MSKEAREWLAANDIPLTVEKHDNPGAWAMHLILDDYHTHRKEEEAGQAEPEATSVKRAKAIAVANAVIDATQQAVLLIKTLQHESEQTASRVPNLEQSVPKMEQSVGECSKNGTEEKITDRICFNCREYFDPIDEMNYHCAKCQPKHMTFPLQETRATLVYNMLTDFWDYIVARDIADRVEYDEAEQVKVLNAFHQSRPDDN